MNTNKLFKGLIGIILMYATNHLSAALISQCDINNGLAQVNSKNPDIVQIDRLLQQCDKEIPNDVRVLLLHGLLARKAGMVNQDYKAAIDWLEKAKARASANYTIPAQELAITYEWNNQLIRAKFIYDAILEVDPDSRSALFGTARIALAQSHLDKAMLIYQNLVQKNLSDVDALNGLARVSFAKEEYGLAEAYYEKVLLLQPNNTDALFGMEQIIKVNQAKLDVVKEPEVANEVTAHVFMSCNANQVLNLLEQVNPPLEEIKKILLQCDHEVPSDSQVLLLHGLLARKQHAYPLAIQWLIKAKAAAAADNPSPALELAITYEWTNKFEQAKLIYEQILATSPTSRAALLGAARVAVDQSHLEKAMTIYHAFLQHDAKDIDAINGMARTQLAQKEYAAAKVNFEKALAIKSNNADAILGLEQIQKIYQFQESSKQAAQVTTIKVVPVCDANQGLLLLNQAKPDFAQINNILAKCDHRAPNDAQSALLHGLLARKQRNYNEAILWLQKAQNEAASDNPAPALELAVTYEWAAQPAKAQLIYDQILKRNAQSRPALLGSARVDLAEYDLRPATTIYDELLLKNPQDVDALTGLARVKLVNKEFKLAHSYFEQALRLDPKNADAKIGLAQLNETTSYILSINEGRYSVSNQQSYGSNVNFYADINATDRLIFQATHNTKEIQLAVFIDPTILPKNSMLGGYQHQVPGKYGWGANFEYRQRTDFTTENRYGANANLYILPNLQWFAGVRNGYPTPWDNQLYFSSLTLYTRIPVNVTVTGFWGLQEIGGATETYVLDFSKEFSNHRFYDLGTAYDIKLHSWQLHARVLWPTFKNQAIEVVFEHYYFNGTTIAGIGWRFYW